MNAVQSLMKNDVVMMHFYPRRLHPSNKSLKIVHQLQISFFASTQGDK